jgi:hypothetical protein
MFRDATGHERRSTARVYASQDLVLGGYLYLGTLDDLSSAEEADPQVVDDAYEIRRFDKLPNLKATEHLRMAWL